MDCYTNMIVSGFKLFGRNYLGKLMFIEFYQIDSKNTIPWHLLSSDRCFTANIFVIHVERNGKIKHLSTMIEMRFLTLFKYNCKARTYRVHAKHDTRVYFWYEKHKFPCLKKKQTRIALGLLATKRSFKQSSKHPTKYTGNANHTITSRARHVT